MVLRQFVAESPDNKSLREEQRDLQDLVATGTLVVADLTDPMLAPDEANGIFQVLLEQFRLKKVDCGKVVVCDEAHKYFGGKLKGGDGLSGAIVDTVRLMRHEGIRVVVSTQSPLTMPPELLELSTVAVCHNFHSNDWYKYMASKLPLSENGFARVQALRPGEGLVFAARTAFGTAEEQQQHEEEPEHDGEIAPKLEPESETCFLVRVRPRITEDRGASKHNVRIG
jgi:DNA helicase HerA-like ATPase